MRWLGCLAVILITTAGCVQFPLAAPKKEKPAAAASALTRTPPPVTADQVSEVNARSKLYALRDELDRAAVTDADPKAEKAAQ
jgi:hypothetical protein